MEKQPQEITLTKLFELAEYAKKKGWLLLKEEGNWDITMTFATPDGIEIIKGIRGNH